LVLGRLRAIFARDYTGFSGQLNRFPVSTAQDDDQNVSVNLPALRRACAPIPGFLGAVVIAGLVLAPMVSMVWIAFTRPRTSGRI
jgi:hypothetical protein